MAIKIVVLAVFVALATVAAQVPFPYKPAENSPVGFKDYAADPIAVAAKAAELRGIAPVNPSAYSPYYNPYFNKYGVNPYTDGEYPYGYNSQLGYQGYYNYPSYPKY